MKGKQLRQREEIENVDLTSDASEKFLAVSTKQESLCSLSSRSSTAVETNAAESQQNLSSSKKANARKLCLAPFYTLLLLLILCVSPDFLFQAKETTKPWQNNPALLCLGEVGAGTESESSL